ncbi:hypothetical protein GCM10009789_15940 [Kribbella sancticallisti]|uniref:DUF998 domain-containing protein n=1 Tax=Kribbella sancticallisti TaxID=460087 RepID=A0ABP4NNX9_9ACTN
MTTTSASAANTTPRVTLRTLLAAGLVAGPLYTAVWLGQAATREGFDITRHPASLLANGGPGWIQTANFVIAGILSIAAAVGLRRAIVGRGSRWAPRLVGAYGVGLLLAAIFPADPAAGFPAGTPADYAEISTRGMGHFVAGSIGFTGLIAACLVMAAHYRSTGRTGWARYSTVTGVLFLGAFVGLMAGAGKPVTIIAFGVAIVLGWSWIAAICADHRRTT